MLYRGKPEPWEEGCKNEGVTVVEYYAAVKKGTGQPVGPCSHVENCPGHVSDGKPTCRKSRTAAPYNVHMKTPRAHRESAALRAKEGEAPSACLSNFPPVEQMHP